MPVSIADWSAVEFVRFPWTGDQGLFARERSWILESVIPSVEYCGWAKPD